jgi:SAM-dependent methyltransferase
LTFDSPEIHDKQSFMGLEKHGAALLLKMWRDQVPFGRCLTLGHQSNALTSDEYCRILRRIGQPPVTAVPAYADPLFLALGAQKVVAMDFSAYEGAGLVHDLNEPVPLAWHQQYDLIFDGGTLEHIFSFPTAIRNCMQLLKPGGRFVSVASANNWCGHGFYQFSPELFYRIFTPANGFSIVEMYMAEVTGRVYAVKDPAVAKSRVELCNATPIYLLVHARREAACDVLVQPPQQSDYQVAWAARENQVANQRDSSPHRRLLAPLRKIRTFLRRNRQQRLRSFANHEWYTPVDFGV